MIIAIEFKRPDKQSRQTEHFNTKTGLFHNQMRGHIEAGACDFKVTNKAKNCGLHCHGEMTLDKLENDVDFVVKLIKQTRKLRKEKRQLQRGGEQIKVGGTE